MKLLQNSGWPIAVLLLLCVLGLWLTRPKDKTCPVTVVPSIPTIIFSNSIDWTKEQVLTCPYLKDRNIVTCMSAAELEARTGGSLPEWFLPR